MSNLFGTEVPANRDASDGDPYTLGTRFTTQVAGQITGARWYIPVTPQPNGEDCIFGLFDGNGELVTSRAYSTSGLEDGWAEFPFDQAVMVGPDETYTVAVYTPGRYVATTSYSWPKTSEDGSLVSAEPGGYFNGEWALTYPEDTYLDGCYFIDVTFEPAIDIAAPVVLDYQDVTTTSPLVLEGDGEPGEVYAVVLSRYSAGDVFTGVTDDGGNTWTQQAEAPPDGGPQGRRIELWTCQPTNAFTAVSAAFTGSGQALGALVHLPGATGEVDAVAANFRRNNSDDGGLNPLPVEITPTVPNTLVLAAIQANANTVAQLSHEAGWTDLAAGPNGPALVYQTNPQAGAAIGVDWTLSVAAGSGHVIAAFVMEALPPPAGPVLTVWLGGVEVPAVIEGVWDGSEIVPALLAAA